MVLKHWRLFDELQKFQAETNRFFADLYRRLALLELAMSNWESLDAIATSQEVERLHFFEPTRPSRTIDVPIEEPASIERAEERPALPPRTTPAVDIYERESDVVARVELPGLRQGDIEVYISGNYLIIRGKISKSIPLPQGVNPDRVRAVYRNGVLEVIVPKDAPARRVEVEFE